MDVFWPENGRLKIIRAMLQLSTMNLFSRLGLSRSFFLLFLGLAATGPSSEGADKPEVVRVTGILGRAKLSREGGAFEPLQAGVMLRPGDVIQTASNSALDLYLGRVIGTLRITESTTLVLEQLSVEGKQFEVQLALRKGELLGNALSVAAGSRFEVKVSNGIAQVLGGRFRVDASGRVILLDGKALFAHVPPGGEAAVHALTAPPAVFFSAASGVKPAPKALQKEVVNQLKSKLPQE